MIAPNHDRRRRARWWLLALFLVCLLALILALDTSGAKETAIREGPLVQLAARRDIDLRLRDVAGRRAA